MKIETTVLEGRHLRLEPLAPHHVPGLTAAIEDGRLWELPVTSVPAPADVPAFVDHALAQAEAGRELAFATVDRASGTVVGSTRYMNIEAAHRRLEIGFTFIAASWQRTHVNTEAKLLMLGHAFEHLGAHRVELRTDVLNTRSRAAIARIGGQQEGVLRQHMVMRGGRIRDTVVFSLVAADWPPAKAALVARLAAPR